MARGLNRLTSKEVLSIKKPGAHADGGGLYLMVSPKGAKRWALIWMRDRRRREMGLGAMKEGDLKRVRERAAALRDIIDAGGDPLALPVAPEPEARKPTFGELCDEVIEHGAVAWRNERTKKQWSYALETQAKPLRDLAVDEVTTDKILDVLKPIWISTPESGSRLRGRIEHVLDAAGAKGLRQGANPARWRGHLQLLLPSRPESFGNHHSALPYPALPTFMKQLQAREAVAAAALELTILTVARTSEVLLAPWAEFDLTNCLWTIPPERMKAGREHRVPLSPGAIRILELAAEWRTDDSPTAFVFPGQKAGKPLSNMAMEMILRRMKMDHVTVHGFRSTFRDWVGEETDFAREVAEAALAHLVGDRVERAYRRGDALAKRRDLMDAWDVFARGVKPPATPDPET